MDISQILMHPGFFVPLALSAVALIVWLVRLEGKNTATEKAIEKVERTNAAEIEKIEKANKANVERLDREIEKLQLQLKVHETNQNIHFNATIAEKVDELNNHRLTVMEEGIKDIHRKLNHMAGRE